MASYSTRWIDPQGNTHYFHGLAKTTYLSGGKDVEAALDEKAGKGDIPESIPWGSVTGKPSTFAPASHNHGAGEIASGTLPIARGGTGAATAAAALTSLGAAAAGHSHGWDQVTGKPSTFAPASHSHGTGDITSGTLPIVRGGTGAATAAAALSNIGAAAASHTHTIAQVGSGYSTEAVTSSYTIECNEVRRSPDGIVHYCVSIYHPTDAIIPNASAIAVFPAGFRPKNAYCPTPGVAVDKRGGGTNTATWPAVFTVDMNGQLLVYYDENNRGCTQFHVSGWFRTI